MAGNPFTPTFGVTPPYLAARTEETELFADALDDGIGSPGRSLLVTGPRGSGKTVLLNAFEDQAYQRKWLVISATTTPGIAAEIAATHMADLLHQHDPEARTYDTTAASVGLGPITGGTEGTYENRVPRPALSFRTGLERLADVADARYSSGVLITLDEIHRSAIDDLRTITQAVQHCFREGRSVALVVAGLPSSMGTLLTDSVTSFIRRSERANLHTIPAPEVRTALEQPITLAGRSISSEALDVATKATRGYPFLIQLIGHRAWNTNPDHDTITVGDVTHAIDGAIRRAGRMIHAPALDDLSDIDRSFLAAMAVDVGPSRIADIAQRLGVNKNYANQYRQRLIAAELITPAGRGMVKFTLPYLREYLVDHPVTDAFTD